METETVEENYRSTSNRMSPKVAATVCGLISAVGYTAANICLRAVVHVDPIWVSCVKAIPTLVAVGPFLIRSKSQADTWFPNKRIFQVILLTGLVGQLGGNVAFQWALSQIGLAIVVPLTLGTLIAVSAVLGRVCLGDSVSPRMIASGIILLIAICILSTEAQTIETVGVDESVAATHTDVDSSADLGKTAQGVFAACFCGIAYCCLSIGIRYATNQGTPRKSVLGLVSLSGVVSLGLATLVFQGVEPITTSTVGDYFAMLMAGVFNYIAFVSLVYALQEASVYFVNALNASQTAMAALAGVFLFSEPFTTTAGFGIGLTIAGLFLMRKGSHD